MKGKGLRNNTTKQHKECLINGPDPELTRVRKNTVCTFIKSVLGHSDTCWYLLIFSICCIIPADAFS